MATDASLEAMSEARLRALIQEYQRDEITALTAQFRGMLVWGLGILAAVLIAIVGFFGSRLWTTVDRHTQELTGLSTNVAALSLSVGGLRDRMDLQFAALQREMDARFAGLQREMDARFATFQKELERTRTEILDAVTGRARQR